MGSGRVLEVAVGDVTWLLFEGARFASVIEGQKWDTTHFGKAQPGGWFNLIAHSFVYWLQFGSNHVPLPPMFPDGHLGLRVVTFCTRFYLLIATLILDNPRFASRPTFFVPRRRGKTATSASTGWLSPKEMVTPHSFTSVLV